MADFRKPVTLLRLAGLTVATSLFVLWLYFFGQLLAAIRPFKLDRSQGTWKLRNDSATFSRTTFIPGSFYEEDISRCRLNNTVRNREDGILEKRLYSISNYTFNEINNKRCTRLDEALVAIKDGSRRWLNPNINTEDSLVAEVHPSYFVPGGCDMPFLSPREVCAAFNQYSQIIVAGDSLSRHMMQGLMMMMKVQRARNLSSEQQRPFHGRGRISAEGSWPLLRSTDAQYGRIFYGDRRVVTKLDCTIEDYKGAVLVIQAGLHYYTDANRTLGGMVDPILNNQMFKACLRLNKVRVIWITLGVQSRKADRRYRHQSRENTLVFNSNMEAGLNERLRNVTIIDWWRLTENSQTSDGVHYLSDVNLVKANHFTNIIKHLEA
ncbi:hypothetical protein THAOC_06306 [Thalassiosira oceanica]|uniref:Uncharacterized protein n=1 Tax=Thalassiosira oceanica TaxID=159749 RepID=K0TF89_THAOC|nr:hypothetical protein THAOC_06306 [Thalassiosira oceanica]|eukprot:EJK72186.1 hypothetical protein THAOC_06306 [Thalassiosira oceanica]